MSLRRILFRSVILQRNYLHSKDCHLAGCHSADCPSDNCHSALILLRQIVIFQFEILIYGWSRGYQFPGMGNSVKRWRNKKIGIGSIQAAANSLARDTPLLALTIDINILLIFHTILSALEAHPFSGKTGWLPTIFFPIFPLSPCCGSIQTLKLRIMSSLYCQVCLCCLLIVSSARDMPLLALILDIYIVDFSYYTIGTASSFFFLAKWVGCLWYFPLFSLKSLLRVPCCDCIQTLELRIMSNLFYQVCLCVSTTDHPLPRSKLLMFIQKPWCHTIPLARPVALAQW